VGKVRVNPYAFSITIENLEVGERAGVDFSDNSRPRPFSTVVGSLDFILTRFCTSGKRGAPYSFEAVTEAGEKFVWNGTLTAAPFRSAGEFGIMNFDLPKYAPH